MTKKRLDEIFREKIISRKERNSYGEWEVVEKVYHEKRPVDTLSSLLRLVNYFVDILVITIILILPDFFLDFAQQRTLDLLTPLIYFGYYILLEFYS